MWTEITRPKYDREGLRYASDLTDREWELIAPFLPPANAVGRPRTTDLREVVNAILYLLRSGLSVAHAADGISAALDGAALFLRLAGQCDMATDQSSSTDGGARGRGTRGQSVRRRDRQPVGENHGKRRGAGF